MAAAVFIDASTAEQRVRAYVIETPLVPSPWLSQAGRCQAYLKLENHQQTGAFKLRGAANKLLGLSGEEAARGVVTASNGNHALAVATMGVKLGIAVEVFVSQHIDPVRCGRIESLGVRVRRVGGDPLLAEQTARQEAQRSGRIYVSPYNDVDVIAGQGTIAVELLRQGPLFDAVFVAVGGGGLIGGIGSHIKQILPATQIIGCWPSHAPALYECLRAGSIVDVEEQPTLSVSTAGGIEHGSVTFEVARKVIDRCILVSEEAILAGLRGLYRAEGQLAEGAAGVAIAGFVQVAAEYANKTVAIIVCGGNADAALTARINDL